MIPSGARAALNPLGVAGTVALGSQSGRDGRGKGLRAPSVQRAETDGRMPGRTIKLDDRDLKILAILQREGRITKSELARRVNLSATPCWARLQRLEEAGVIEGYGARIAFDFFAPRTYAFVTIELDSHRSEDFDRFEALIGTIPEIFECFAVGGGIDYVIKIAAPDVEAYQQLLDGILHADAGVKRYYTYFVTKDVKHTPPPLELGEGLGA